MLAFTKNVFVFFLGPEMLEWVQNLANNTPLELFSR